MVRVLILHDHDLARHGSRQALAAEPHIDVVGDTRVVGQALEMLASARPQVAIVDLLRGDGDGIIAARQIRSANASVRVLLLVADADVQARACVLLAGASGYVRRTATAAAVIAVQRLSQGYRLIDTADIHAAQMWITKQLGGNGESRPGDQVRDHVRDRLLELITAGYADPDIMTRMLISQRRIDSYLADIAAVLHLPGTRPAAVERVAAAHVSPSPVGQVTCSRSTGTSGG